MFSWNYRYVSAPSPPNRTGGFDRIRLSRNQRSASGVTTGFVIFIRVPHLHHPIQVTPGTFYLESIDSLAPFALYAAFPRSDYYGASDAHTGHQRTALFRIPV